MSPRRTSSSVNHSMWAEFTQLLTMKHLRLLHIRHSPLECDCPCGSKDSLRLTTKIFSRSTHSVSQSQDIHIPSRYQSYCNTSWYKLYYFCPYRCGFQMPPGPFPFVTVPVAHSLEEIDVFGYPIPLLDTVTIDEKSLPLFNHDCHYKKKKPSKFDLA